MGKNTSRVLAGAVLAASLTGFGAGIASAGAGIIDDPDYPFPNMVQVTDDPIDDDDLTRGGLGSPIGDAGQLKVHGF